MMNDQLEAVVREFSEATGRLGRLQSSLSREQWSTRRDPNRWSPIECVAHLNLTAEAYVPRISEGLKKAPRGDAAYRRDFMGWFLWKILKPPVRFRTKTAASFVPTADEDPNLILERFARYQEQQIELVKQCEGLQIDRVNMRSPFDPRIQYNLWSGLTILSRHQHRHLWQAEQAVE